MNFSSAFKYPFQNLAKVISIVLALSIVLSVFIAMVLNTYDWVPFLKTFYGIGLSEPAIDTVGPFSGTTIIGVFGFLLTAIISGFWISGYSIEAIRSVMRSEEWLPAIDFRRNLKDGIYLFASSVAYLVLFVGAIVVAFLAFALTSSIGIMSALVSIAWVVVIVALFFVMGWAFFVGMARFAAEGNPKASLQVWTNMRIATKNWRAGFTLLLYMIALTVIYYIVSSVVGGIIDRVAGSTELAAITLSIIVYYVFSLTQHFSTQHLIAQYAVRIDIESVNIKGKVDFL